MRIDGRTDRLDEASSRFSANAPKTTRQDSTWNTACKWGDNIKTNLNEIGWDSGVPRNFVRRWGSTNSVQDRGHRENGDLGAVAP